ncbi:MAG TPA: Na+/H+ antiporter NhaA [Acidimicrobiales bacterium]|nr:Na+/H+ antiporter NhaA [Acidimicrobiales bacterium]
MSERRFVGPLASFLQTEAGGGALLLVATVVALGWANSPWADGYFDFWHTKLQLGPDGWGIREDLQHWVNDALMAVFFFLIGLEIKREAAVGELREVKAAVLPALGALGGMAVPALLFVLLAGGGKAAQGWGIPMATDIAFAVGVLALLGPRVPGGLKVFLLTLAIIDDIGAIVVIAVFYSGGVAVPWLAAAAVCLAAVVAWQRFGFSSPLAYVPLGIVAWYCTYRAGVHPTIAGVALGVLTPAHPVDGRHVLEDLEHRLHPWSSFLVVPVFALANAGVALGDGALGRALSSRVALAVFVGLVVGKTLGISSFVLGARRFDVGRLPDGVHGGHVVGTAALGGIGFTVALFITGLAFEDAALQDEAKIGILAASVVAGLIGAAVLAVLRDPKPEDVDLPAATS